MSDPLATPAVKAGTRLRSAVSDVEVIVVRAPAAAVTLECGGAGLLPIDSGQGEGRPTDGEQTLLGKRYVDDELGIELLCTKGGEGALTVDGRPLTVKGAKTLPSSD